MSAENVENVRAAYEAFGRGDLETVAGHFAEDVEWETPDSVPLGGLVSGRDAVIGNFAQLPSLWSSFSVEPQEYIDAARPRDSHRRAARDRPGRIVRIALSASVQAERREGRARRIHQRHSKGAGRSGQLSAREGKGRPHGELET